MQKIFKTFQRFYFLTYINILVPYIYITFANYFKEKIRHNVRKNIYKGTQV